MMKTRTTFTRTFKVRDSSGAVHEVYEYTTFNLSVAGGKDNWYPADKNYKTKAGDVGHQAHKQFQLPGSTEWLKEC
jgi:hypothetical protein